MKPSGTVASARQPKLPAKTKLAYNAGTFLDTIGLHAVNNLAYPVYNVILGVNPALIGYALAAFRLWDALADPVVGAMTDRASSKWGRRKPFMVAGAILSAIVFPIVYFASPAWSENLLLGFFVAIGLVYFTFHTVFAISYQAFGLELAPNYDDRTSLFAYKSVFMLLGFMGLGWVYPFAQSDLFSSPLSGIRWISTAAAVFLLATALIPILLVRERFGSSVPAQPKETPKESAFQSIKAIVRDAQFRRLALIQVVIVFGSNVVNALGFYLAIYYLYDGDSKAAAPLMSVSAAANTAVSIGAMFALPSLGRRLGKVNTVKVCLAIELIGSALKWVCITPHYPWLSIIPAIFLSVGNIGFWALAPSLVSDLCDIEELASGKRREGGYASITQWFNKLGYTVATALSGVVLVWIGFEAKSEAGQPAETLFWLKLLFTVVPAVSFAIALLCLRGLDITRARIEAAQSELEARRGRI